MKNILNILIIALLLVGCSNADKKLPVIGHPTVAGNDTVYTIPRLKEFAENLGVDSHKWFFVTGEKDSIYSAAANSYFATAYPDESSPGNYIHSGGLLLVDIHKHIRGVYDGTNPKETDRLIADMKILLHEQFQ